MHRLPRGQNSAATRPNALRRWCVRRHSFSSNSAKRGPAILTPTALGPVVHASVVSARLAVSPTLVVPQVPDASAEAKSFSALAPRAAGQAVVRPEHHWQESAKLAADRSSPPAFSKAFLVAQ